MATITLRSTKGSPLTNNEVDANFTNLNTDKAELSGATFTGNLSLGDNVKLQLGNQTDGDLQIYHDGSNSYIREDGVGSLRIQGADLELSNPSEIKWLKGYNNNRVELFFNNAIKLSTTSTGADINGVLTADGLTVDGDALISGGSSATNTGATLQLESTETAGVGTGASISFKGDDGTGSQRTYGLIKGSKTTASTDFSGGLDFFTRVNGVSNATKRIAIASNGDISFYNDSAAQGLFWDSSTSRLGLGVTNPSDELTIRSTQFNTTQISIGDTGDRLRLGYIHASALESATAAGQIATTAGSELKIAAASNAASKIILYTNASSGTPSERLRINADGSSIFSGSVTADEIKVGATDRIYLDGGSNTYIQESASDDLRFFVGGQQAVRVRTFGTDILGTVTADGLTVDGDVDIGTDSATSSAKVTIQAQGANGSDETALVLRNYSASPYTGYVTQEYEVGTVSMAEISARRVSSTNGELIFRTKQSGTITDALNIASNGDISFYNGSANQGLFFDSSTSRLGLGVTNPVSALAMHGNAGTTYITQTNTANNQTLEMGNAYSLITGANGSHSAIVSDHTLLFGTSNTERLRINADGSSVFSGAVSVNNDLVVNTTNNTPAIWVNTTGSGNLQNWNKNGGLIASVSNSGAVTSTGLPLNVNTSMYATDHSLSYYGSTNGVYLNGAGNSGWLRLNASGGSNDSVSHNLFGINAGNLQTFKTNSTLAMQIDASQNVNIPNGSLMVGSTTAPSATLEVGALSSGSTGNVIINHEGGVTPVLQVKARTNRAILAVQDNDTSGYISSENGIFSIGRNSGSNANNINIDANNNVGIGTNSPSASTKVNIKQSAVSDINGLNGIRLDHSTGTAYSGFGLHNTDAVITAGDAGGTANTNLLFRTATSGSEAERMRLNSDGSCRWTPDGTNHDMTLTADGNLLVGKTSADNTTAGCRVRGDGFASFVRSGAEPVLINRLTSQGSLLTLQKDGTTVGSIGVIHGNNLFIGAPSHSGLQFGGSIIYPTNGSNGNATNGVVDLGGTSTRFKDLYLSGGVYLGGTGSANKLDDYEEGTFTPAIKIGGAGTGITYVAQSGSYTKIGQFVYCAVRVQLSASGSLTGSITLDGLPFTVGSSQSNRGGITINFLSSTSVPANFGQWLFLTEANATNASLRYYNTSSGNATDATESILTNTTTLWCDIKYQVA